MPLFSKVLGWLVFDCFLFFFYPQVFCSLLISFAEITTGGGEGKGRPTADLKQCNSESFGKPLLI